jgi:hypothetical protein
MSVIYEQNSLLFIRDGILEIGRIAKAVEASLLGITKIHETHCFTRVPIVCELNCLLLI